MRTGRKVFENYDYQDFGEILRDETCFRVKKVKIEIPPGWSLDRSIEFLKVSNFVEKLQSIFDNPRFSVTKSI